MPGPVDAAWVIPIVVAIVLFGWVAAVLRADTRPSWKHHSKLPKYEVTGGAFQAVDGGRQLMPRYAGRPIPTEAEMAQAGQIPAPRAGEEQAAPAQAAATHAAQGAHAQPGAGQYGDQAHQRHLVAGSKLR